MNNQTKVEDPEHLDPEHFAGLAGFILAGISASLSTVAILTWMYMAEKNLYLEGGAAFAANFGPLLFFLSGLVIGQFATLSIVGSLCMSRKPFLRAFTLYHVAGLVMLGPSFYLAGKMLF